MAKETNTRSDTSGNPTHTSSNFPTSTQIRYPDTRVGQAQISKNMETNWQKTCKSTIRRTRHPGTRVGQAMKGPLDTSRWKDSSTLTTQYRYPFKIMYIDMAKETNTRSSDTSDNPTLVFSCFPTITQIRYPDTRVGQTQIGKTWVHTDKLTKNL